MQLDFFKNVIEEQDTDCGTKLCRHCNTVKPNTTEYFDPYYRSGGGKHESMLRAKCKECYKKDSAIYYQAKKKAPPRPDSCDCCGISFDDISPSDVHFDHDHETGEARGWLCKPCNVGLGMLGDNIEGLEQAIRYLKKNE